MLRGKTKELCYSTWSWEKRIRMVRDMTSLITFITRKRTCACPTSRITVCARKFARSVCAGTKDAKEKRRVTYAYNYRFQFHAKSLSPSSKWNRNGNAMKRLFFFKFLRIVIRKIWYRREAPCDFLITTVSSRNLQSSYYRRKVMSLFSNKW